MVLAPKRVISLLPSATENFCALLQFAKERRGISLPGIALPAGSDLPQLVGRSHECDTPATPDVQSLPILTAARTAFTTSADVHKQVREALAEATSLYHLNAAKMVELQPDVILTQSTCTVCSIDLASVNSVLDPVSSTKNSTPVCSTTDLPEIPGKTTTIVTTNPISLADVLIQQFQRLGHELGLEEEGNAMASAHQAQMDQLQALGQARRLANERKGKKMPRVMLVEWLDPLFIGKMGWMREVIEHASAEVVETLEGDPKIDIIIVACCGLSLAKSEDEIRSGRVGDWWKDALTSNPDVYLVDGMSMFSRPTPKLLAALEWLVNVAHCGEEGDTYLRTTRFPFKKFDVAGAMKQLKTDTSSTGALSTRARELADIEELHRVACQNKQAMYTDPATGYSVMTAYNLRQKQVCCGNGCRHCPYGHVNVKDPARRTNKLTETVVLQPKKRQRGTRAGGNLLWPRERVNAHLDDTIRVEDRDLVVMFWSGGKDSFLSLTTLYADYARQSAKPMPRVVLLTSVDPVTHTVPIQNIRHDKIAQQADALGLPLCTVAVGLGHSYAPQIHEALAELPARMAAVSRSDKHQPIHSLVFGDLHLEDIRAWREETFGSEYTLQFPVWKKDTTRELLPLLQETCARTKARVVFANIESEVVKKHGFQIGDAYDMDAVRALNTAHGVDLMGESGEFHTCVVFPGMVIAE